MGKKCDKLLYLGQRDIKIQDVSDFGLVSNRGILYLFRKFEIFGNHEPNIFSNEDMILALAGQFKQLSHEPEKFR